MASYICCGGRYIEFQESSEKLMLSQPSVTVHIKLLEEYLGVQLFDRINNRVTLTDAGRLFYAEAMKLLAKIG